MTSETISSERSKILAVRTVACVLSTASPLALAAAQKAR